ncbi:Fc.00g045010.m01.CDS01 [Cosmosporella sp. VM-42]
MLHIWIVAVGFLLSVAQACLLPHERDANLRGGLHRRQSDEEMKEYATEDYFALIRNSSMPVASNTTDRFKNGQVVPRGLGSQPSNTTITEAMNVVEMNSALKGLAKEFKVDMFYLPEKTHDNAVMYGAKISSQTCNSAYRVFLTAGLHARERGGPDNLIYFISDLLWASREGTGVTYGSRKYNNSEVNKALSAGIVILPLVNPDGVVFDQTTNLCWRKNRNPKHPVDLNRNFDFLWNFTQHFAPSVEPASTDPDSEAYYGTGPFSEPETRNIRWIFDSYKKINWYIDIHSFAGLVIYPWGDDENQDSDQNQNFMNSKFDGKRGLFNDQEGYEYKDYINTNDWNDSSTTARRIASGMEAGNGGRQVEALQAALFYPTSGSSADYAYSRAMVNSDVTKVRGFGVEFGAPNEAMGNISCPFYPNQTLFNENIRSMGAGLMEFLLSAVDIGVGGEAYCEDHRVQVSAAVGYKTQFWATLLTCFILVEVMRHL